MSSLLQIPVVWQTALLLTASNVFMTFESYTERNTCRVSQFTLHELKLRSSSGASTCPKSKPTFSIK
ncbi:MAG: hypothetical protein Q8J99_20905, partial [Sulfuritalea sp.]|nr:hypothetical protein [Sulfuritalea sp.]